MQHSTLRKSPNSLAKFSVPEVPERFLSSELIGQKFSEHKGFRPLCAHACCLVAPLLALEDAVLGGRWRRLLASAGCLGLRSPVASDEEFRRGGQYRMLRIELESPRSFEGGAHIREL